LESLRVAGFSIYIVLSPHRTGIISTAGAAATSTGSGASEKKLILERQDVYRTTYSAWHIFLRLLEIKY